MCVMIYLASPTPLPLVQWNEASPSFYVSEIAPDERRVSSQFKFSNIYYLGSHQGCSCGLAYGGDGATPDEQAEFAAAAGCIELLRRYMARAAAMTQELELFACWDGDQELAPGSRSTLRIEDISLDTFGEVEPPLYFVVRGRAA